MILMRSVQPETLDHLDQADPRAIRSRADLRRIHRIMRTRSIMISALRNIGTPKRIIELGAGDGTLMLGVARKLAAHWPQLHLTLLDRQSVVAPETISAFRTLGWQPEVLNLDVMDWAQQHPRDHYDLVVANLFLHHFENGQLRLLLRAIAQRANAFFACEPRRGLLPLIGSHLVGFVGANAVTREDAVLSVHAGFTGDELARLSAREFGQWQVREYPAGLFSHCFLAIRQSE